MAHYQGTMADGNRARDLAKQRQEQKVEFDRMKERIRLNNQVSLQEMDEIFQSQDTRADEHFKRSTVGLVSAEDFKKKRLEAEQKLADEEEAKRREKEKAKKRKAREREKKMAALSFNLHGEEVEHELEQQEHEKAADKPANGKATEEKQDDAVNGKDGASDDEDGGPSSKRRKLKGFGKDPAANTYFLPDKDREEEEARIKEQLAKEFKAKQEEIKAELIEVTYSYWDGSGHRRTIKVPKGTKMDQFLELCRRELCESFHELRGASSDTLMYIKEDLIIPHHFSFYDLIVSKARGKSGPLFKFGAYDDVRLINDVRVEKDESHAGKIVTRAWYERNKHIFPASRWEVYDPSMTFDKYTVK